MNGRTGSPSGRALEVKRGKDPRVPGWRAGSRQPTTHWRQAVQAPCPRSGDQVTGVSGRGWGRGAGAAGGWLEAGGRVLAESDVGAPEAPSPPPASATPGAQEAVGCLWTQLKGFRTRFSPPARLGAGRERQEVSREPSGIGRPHPPAPRHPAPLPQAQPCSGPASAQFCSRP